MAIPLGLVLGFVLYATLAATLIVGAFGWMRRSVRLLRVAGGLLLAVVVVAALTKEARRKPLP